ncbi:putative transmembrane protein [Plasmopara halstedii]
MKNVHYLPPFFDVSAALAASLNLVDVVLNALIEYGDLPGQETFDNDVDSIATFVQVVLQITALFNLFVLLAGTFLFRSGLFGMLYSQFRIVLLMHPLYICLTVILVACRMTLLSSENDRIKIWDNFGYLIFSGMHKIGALLYYVCSIYAVEQLRNRKYYTFESWMQN